MNIDKAIASKSYVIQGVKGFNPGPANARLFAIAINEKTASGYEVLNIVFDMSTCWGAHYMMSSPKKEPFARRMYLNSKELLDVSDKFKDEVVGNQTLRDLFIDWIKQCHNPNEEGMVRNATSHFEKLTFVRQQGLMVRIADEKAREERISKACEYAKQKAGSRKYSFYREYYVSGRIPNLLCIQPTVCRQ